MTASVDLSSIATPDDLTRTSDHVIKGTET